jgi:hypothetical protein
MSTPLDEVARRRSPFESRAKDDRLIVLEQLRLARAVTVILMTVVVCLGLASAAASARAESSPPVAEDTPITLEGETKVAAEGSGGAAVGVVTTAAILYPIIRKALVPPPAERRIVPELSAVANPLQKTALVENAALEVEAADPALDSTLEKAIEPVLTALRRLEPAPCITASCDSNADTELIEGLTDAAETPNLPEAEVEVVNDLRANVKEEARGLAEQQFGLSSPADLPPLPPLPAPPKFVKDPEAEADVGVAETITEIEEDDVVDAEGNPAAAQLINQVDEATIDPSLPSVTSTPEQLLQDAAKTPALDKLSAVVGASPQDPIQLTPSGGIETTVGELDALSAAADKQTTGITEQTVTDVKDEVGGTLTPQQVVADETNTLDPELESDSVVAELPEQILKDGTAGDGVSSAATGAEGAAKIVASDAVDETAEVGEEGLVDGAEEAIVAGEASSSLVDPLMLVQLATQLPQIITQIVQLIKGEPNFEQQVLSALGSIKEQISALSEQVTDGFADVDETLRVVGTKIEQDTQLLEHVAANGGQLQSDLAEITGKLDQIQATLYRIAESAREETLNTALNTDIGYDERFGEELPLPEFAKTLGLFFTWGDESSLDAVSEHKGGSTAPNQVAAELQGTEGANALNENLDYLASFADKGGWLDGLPALDENVPNPEVWATASNAYSQLLLENTGDVTGGVKSSLGELESVGKTLRPFIGEITEKGSSYAPMEVDGVKIDTGSSILNHALAYYLESAVAPKARSGMEPSLANRIKAEQNATLAAQQPAATEESFGHCVPCRLAAAPTSEAGNAGEAFINPWEGASQAPSGHLPALEAASDPEQKNSGGVSKLGEMNLCRFGTAAEGISNQETENYEASLPGWLPKTHSYESRSGESLQSDAALVPLYESSLKDPLPAMFTNAWHLGFGRLTSCYAVEPSGSGIKMQLNYMWEWPGHINFEKEVLMRATITDPLPHARGCFSNPVEGVHDLWTELVADEKEAKKENFNCWLEELNPPHQVLLSYFNDINNWVRGHWDFVGEFNRKVLNSTACKKEIISSEQVECEVSLITQPDVFETEFRHNPLEGEVLSETVGAKLAQLRQDLNKHIAEPNASESLNEEAPADVQAAAVRVNGARALLDDYIELGMPQAMTEDPRLRNFVLGVGDDRAAAEQAGDHMLDNSPGAPNVYSVFTKELGEIEGGGRPAILWPAAFPQEPCVEACPAEVGLEEHADPVAEEAIEEPHRSPARKNEHDGVVSFAFKRGVEQLSRRIHTDLGTGATSVVAAEPIVEAAATQLELTRELLAIAPVNTKAPAVTGTPVVGEMLSCSPGSWESQSSPAFSYRWLRNGASIHEGSSYVATGDDVGQELACEVTASNREREATSATSGAVEVAAAALGMPPLPVTPLAVAPPAASGGVLSEQATFAGELVPNPNLTIRTEQKLKGSTAGFSTRQLTVTLTRPGVAAGRRKRGRRPQGQTIEYQITLSNTGNVPLALTRVSDPYCAALSSGGSFGKQLQPGASALYSCRQTVSRDGTYLNQATVEATPPVGDGFMISRASNEAVALGPHPEPTAETGGATEVGLNTAVLAGDVNPHGRRVTSCEFEYWTTAATQRATCARSPGRGTSPVNVTARIESLSPGTTYHYRIAAGNPTGTSRGNAKEFTTPAAPEAVTG